MDVSVGRHIFLDVLYSITSIASFVTVGYNGYKNLKDYRSKLINAYYILDNIIFTAYLFSIERFLQLILTGELIRYLTVDPITVSITLTAVLSQVSQ